MGLGIQLEGPGNQLHAHGHPVGADVLVDHSLDSYVVRHRKVGQPAFNLHFRDHVLFVVILEELPFDRIMPGKTVGMAPVTLGGFIGDIKTADQYLVDRQLLLVL